MSDFSADLNGVRVLRVRLVTCWRGPWFVDVDLDPDSDPVTSTDVPAGAVTLTITPPGGTPIVLKGTVDPEFTGRWISGVPVRVIAGGAGWSKTATAQQFHSDGGVSSLTVEKATAADVGETVVDAAPVALGVDWTRIAGPARRIFGNRDWYVDTAGVTQVASRPAATADASVEILEWEPAHQRGVLSADALVLPGTTLTDPRFDGPITVRDVVQTFAPAGNRVEVFCGANPAGRLLAGMTTLVRELGETQNLKEYRYRIVTQADDGRLTLQAVPNADGSKSDAPDLNPASVWPGMAGLKALYKLSSQVIVTLINGDPALPAVVGFDGTIPQELTLDASGIVHIGPTTGAVVKLAEGAADYGGQNVARNGDTCTVMLPPECPMVGTVAGLPFVGVVTFAFPCPGIINSGASSVLA